MKASDQTHKIQNDTETGPPNPSASLFFLLQFLMLTIMLMASQEDENTIGGKLTLR